MGSVYFQEPSTDGAPGIWELEDALRFQALGKWPGLFTPAKFFANGEQGAWYDPSDLTTLFQDAAGTVPVTADGDPVGLMLDKRAWGGKTLEQVLEDQPELNPNPGPFTSTGGYTASNGTLAIVDDAIEQTTATAASSTCSIPISTTVGKTYFLEYEARRGTSSSVGIAAGTSPTGGAIGNVVITSNVLTSGVIIFTATTTTTYLLLINYQAVSGRTGYVRRLSCKEIPGNHATQVTTAARPTYRDIGGVRYLESDGVDDALNVNLPAGAYTQAYVTAADVMTIDEGVAISGPENVMREQTIAGILYIDRALTSDEKAKLAAYWGATL